MQKYQAFGLSIASALPLPDFPAMTGDTADILVDFGVVPQQIEGAVAAQGVFEGKPGQLLLTIPGVARYLITQPGSITIDRAPGASDEDIRTFLLGSALGAILHMRSLLVLHASAVRIGNGAVVFCGRSGDGKSTLAAGLTQRGYSMLSDDVSAVEISATGGSIVYPAFPRARLWQNSVDHLEYPVEGGRVMRDQIKGKLVLPVAKFHNEPCPVRAIYRLNYGEPQPPQIIPISEQVMCQELIRVTYRKAFMKALGTLPQHFSLLTSLLRAVPIAGVSRPSETIDSDGVIDAILNDLEAKDSRVAG